MDQGKYGKYIIEEPTFLTDDVPFHDFSKVKGFTFPNEVYMDEQLCPEADSYISMAWIWEKTIPVELPQLHVHPFDEIVMLIGSDPKNLRDLGGQVSWGMGEGDDAETFVITKSTAIWVPANLHHGPLVYDRVDRPILNLIVCSGSGAYV